MGRVKIPYYVVKHGKGYWQPTKEMRKHGFLPFPCGKDGPDAWAKYLAAYAGEMAWREDRRRMSNSEQYLMMAAASASHPVSRQWKGYWQRATKN